MQTKEKNCGRPQNKARGWLKWTGSSLINFSMSVYRRPNILTSLVPSPASSPHQPCPLTSLVPSPASPPHQPHLLTSLISSPSHPLTPSPASSPHQPHLLTSLSPHQPHPLTPSPASSPHQPRPLTLWHFMHWLYCFWLYGTSQKTPCTVYLILNVKSIIIYDLDHLINTKVKQLLLRKP